MAVCEFCNAPYNGLEFGDFSDTGDVQLCPSCLTKKEPLVSKPKHYSIMTQDVISFCLINKLDFMQGNIIKYVCRYQKKNGLEDLKKAKDYLDRLITMVEKGVPG